MTSRFGLQTQDSDFEGNRQTHDFSAQPLPAKLSWLGETSALGHLNRNMCWKWVGASPRFMAAQPVQISQTMRNRLSS